MWHPAFLNQPLSIIRRLNPCFGRWYPHVGWWNHICLMSKSAFCPAQCPFWLVTSLSDG
jgi:hypothetical protein